jgi:putative transposase
MLLTEGQVSDHKGAAVLIDALPPARHLIADRGYDSDFYRAALRHRGITPCIPSRKNRKAPVAYDKLLYRRRHKVENLFAKLKDWRRIAMRYDRRAHTFMSAIHRQPP